MEELRNTDSVKTEFTELSLDDRCTVVGGDLSGFWAGALVGTAVLAGAIGAPLLLAAAGIAAYELVQ